MALERHQEAERLMAVGDRMSASGDEAAAKSAYRAAANEERAAYPLIPAGRPRTRGVTAISSVSLLSRAGDHGEAVRRAYEFLSDAELPDWARGDLEDLIVELRAQDAARAQERELAGSWLEWRLQGGDVGYGIAPLDLVARKIDQIQNAAVRVYEMLAGLDLRTHGPPPAAVRSNLQLTIAQPTAGSFRFRTRFSAPLEQPTLFDDGDVRSVDPDAVATGLFALMGAVAGGDPEELLRTPAPNAGYRKALLQLAKVLVPDGRTVRTIEVVRGQSREATEATLLAPQARRPLDTALRVLRPPRQSGTLRVEIVDTLRGIHLNEGWIVLGRGPDQRKAYVGSEIVLEDVIKGLVDETVKVIGHFQPSSRAEPRVIIDEIAEAPGETSRFVTGQAGTRVVRPADFGLIDDEAGQPRLSSGEDDSIT